MSLFVGPSELRNKSPSSWWLQVWSGGANVSTVLAVHSLPQTRRVRSGMLWGTLLRALVLVPPCMEKGWYGPGRFRERYP